MTAFYVNMYAFKIKRTYVIILFKVLNEEQYVKEDSSVIKFLSSRKHWLFFTAIKHMAEKMLFYKP